MKTGRNPSPLVKLSAGIFTCAVLDLSYVLLGFLPMLLFAFGFLGGFIVWLVVPTGAPFAPIRIPYFATLLLFVAHKLEERYLGFFPALSKITGVPVPESGTLLTVLLYACAGAWLLIPVLMKREQPIGSYLAWTFFTAMGVTELAHFIFPFFTPEPYGYFPGMASVVLLAPVAWLGMWRLWGATAST